MITNLFVLFFQVEKTRSKRYYVSFFNATADIVGNLTIPMTRGAGDVKASYSDFSLNATTGFTEGLVEFTDQIWNYKLEEHLAEQGAACITILTFQNNDNNQSAGAALARVWKAGKQPGFEQVTRGNCNAKLLAKAQEMVKEDEKNQAAAGQLFDAKTQECIKLSLETMQATMVTKDDLTKMDETLDELNFKLATKDDLTKMDKITQQHMDDIKKSLTDSLTAEFSKTITNQAQTITALQDTVEKLENIIITKDRDNQTLEDKNYSQRCVLARLNQEKTEDARRIKLLTDKLEAKDKTILKLVEENHNSTAKNTIAEKICEVHAFMRDYLLVSEDSRKRKPV